MSEKDALSSFDFSGVIKSGVYLKFEPGKPIVVRVLTTDPVVFNTSFEDKKTGETIVATKFAWVIYNFSAKAAQVMQTTPNLAKKLQELHTDVDFGADLKSIDLKITPPAPGVIAAYDVQVLPKTQVMTDEQIKECMKINLDELFEDKGGIRMNSYDPKQFKAPAVETEPVESVDDDADLITDGEPIDLADVPF